MCHEFYREVMDGSCPQCFTMLLVVSFPTFDEIELAAAAGIEEALDMLDDARRARARGERLRNSLLTSATQLPDVEVDHLDLELDLVRDKEENFYIVKLGETVLWKELASYEDYERFSEIKSLLKAKYAARFIRLSATDKARANMLGDALGEVLRETFAPN